MTALPGYLDLFISPITGKLSGIGSLPSLPENYILLGDQNGTAQPSLVLQDLRLDFIRLKENLYESAPILQTAAKPFANGQALDQLTPGIMKQTDGIVATAIPNVDYATEERLQELVDEAEGYRDEAQQSATDASNSASDAAGSARSASLSSTTASLSATEAAASAATATTAAGTAVTAAATASGFSVAAATSAGIASTASETARGYSDAAQGYANDAEAFATNSQNSATDSYNYLQELLTTGFTFTGDVTGSGVLSSPIPLSLALTLNQIKSPTDNIDVDDYKIVNLEDPVNPQDAVNYRTLMSYVGGTENLTLVGDGTASGPLSAPITFTLTKTLNNITNAGDVSLAGYKITNLALPGLPTDGVNKFYVDNHTWTSSQITDFTSAVQSNPVNTLAPATGNLNMNSYSINNVADPVNPTDGSNKNYVDTQIADIAQSRYLISSTPTNPFTFSNTFVPTSDTSSSNTEYFLNSYNAGYSLNHITTTANNVGTFALKVTDTSGNSYTVCYASYPSISNPQFVVNAQSTFTAQGTFNSTLNIATTATTTNTLNFNNTFTPTSSTPAINTETFINTYGGGYSFVHQTLNTDASQIGQFQLNMINLDSSSTNLITCTQNLGYPEIIINVTTIFEGGLVDFTGTSIYVNNPIDGSQASSKAYVDTHTWPSTSITDLDATIRSYSLSDFRPPTNNLSMYNFILRDVADPQLPTDGTNMEYVDNHTWLASSITDLATALLAYPLNYFSLPTDNISMNSHYLRDVADPQRPQDAATMNYVDNHTWLSASITDLYTYITTIPLNNFLQPAAVIDMNSQRIADVGDPMYSTDAANMRYVDGHTWLSSSITDLYAYITSIPLNNMLQPQAVIDMNSQRIADVGYPIYGPDAANVNYVNTQIANIPQSRYLTSTIPGNAFTFSNTCIPTYAGAVSNSESFINVYGGGYAFIHINYSTDTTQIGEFDFSIINLDSSYTNLMTFSQSGGIPEIVVNATAIFKGGLVDFTGTSIYVNNPIDGAQAASKAYVDSSLSAFRAVTSSTSSNLFSFTNTFTPTSGNPSTNTETFINVYGAGYEFIHQTLSTDTSQIGTFAFNAIGPTSGGNTVYPLMTAYYFGAAQLSFACPITFNGQVTFATAVTVQTPTTAGNPATKNYVDTTTPYVLRPSGCIYFQANATGATATANTWLKMVGTTTSSQLNLFTTTVNNQLKYTGATGITANIITNASVQVSSTGTTQVSLSIYKNGARWAPSINSGQTTAASTPIRLSVNAQIPLVTNDYIEVWYESSVATTITATYMSTTISPV